MTMVNKIYYMLFLFQMNQLQFVTLFASVVLITQAVKENAISVSDTGEGTDCDADIQTANICLECSRLNQDIAVPLTVCCSEPKAFTVCQICTKDPKGCLDDARSISSEEFIDDDDDSEEDAEVDKRYGRMFMGGWGYPGSTFGKRFGKMFFGGRNYFIPKSKDKRFGRLFSGDGYRYGKVGKRFGRLFTGGNKRYGSLFLGKW